MRDNALWCFFTICCFVAWGFIVLFLHNVAVYEQTIAAIK